MINSYAHMGIAMKYHYDTEALNIAEGGVHWAIYQLEQHSRLHEIPATQTFEEYLGHGKFIATIHNNISSSTATSAEARAIPPYSIMILSTGTVRAGEKEYKKTVEALVNYQLIPYTVSSEGTIKMNIGEGESLAPGESVTPVESGDPPASDLESFTAVISSIDGFTGNLHSNYSGEPTYRCTLDPSRYVHLQVDGGTLSSSGKVGIEAENKINSNGGHAVSDASPKRFLKVDYKTLYNKANSKSPCVSLDDKVPSLAEFLGEMRNNNGELQGRVKIAGVKMWVDIEHVILFGNCLPKGMKWEPGTGTLVIEENRNYKWDGKLNLKGINIRVEGTKSSGLFVTGNITSDNTEIIGNSFSLVSNKDITLTNASLNITSSDTTDGIAVYANNLTMTTKKDKVPAGGNRFKGIVYTEDGKVDLTNQYKGNIDNFMILEGLIINNKSDSTDQSSTGLKVKNKGGSDFKIELKYNPYVAKSMIDYTNGSVHLQPVYWQID